MGEGTPVAKAKDGSWLLQALGALLILGPIGVCARAEQAVCHADRIALGSAAPTRERRDLVRAQLRGMPLERAIAHSKFSRSFAVSEVAGFQKAFWTGQSFRAGGNRYQIVFGWDRSTRDQVRAWCAAHAVRCDGF
jgi:hypothetical protein